MVRHTFTPEERSRGGKTRCQQDSMTEARQRGFEITMERHPFFARHHLKLKIKQQNKEREQQKTN